MSFGDAIHRDFGSDRDFGRLPDFVSIQVGKVLTKLSGLAEVLDEPQDRMSTTAGASFLVRRETLSHDPGSG